MPRADQYVLGVLLTAVRALELGAHFGGARHEAGIPRRPPDSSLTLGRGSLLCESASPTMRRAARSLIVSAFALACGGSEGEDPSPAAPVRAAPEASGSARVDPEGVGTDSKSAAETGELPPQDAASETATATAEADPAHTPEIAPPGPLAATENERNTIAVFDAAAPATVFVTQRKRVVDRWTRQALEVPAGSGSGFIWDESGHVVTNFHVVDGAQSLTVTLLGDRTFPAKFVGGDRQKDLAVLKIELPEGDRLTPIRVRPADEKLRVGEKALAIGNPFGLDHTLTVGVVSALGREVEGFGGVTIGDMIQTDAPINPGNSGGPLLDARGRLIGINTMIYSKSGSSAGIGFAVPSNTVRRVVPQLIRHGGPIRAGLGITIVSDELATRNKIAGVVIERVAANSPADRAGMKGLRRSRRGTFLGDVIIAIDDEKISNYDNLYTQLDGHEPGDDVKVTVLRADKRYDVMVELTAVQLGGR